MSILNCNCRCACGLRAVAVSAIVGVLAAFFLIALLRIFSAPLRVAHRLLSNTLLGFLALWIVNLTASITGIALGMNFLNALTIGILGVPGFVLLLLIQWVL
jgi:inhibitor of the pro-sigma K processing machinery